MTELRQKRSRMRTQVKRIGVHAHLGTLTSTFGAACSAVGSLASRGGEQHEGSDERRG